MSEKPGRPARLNDVARAAGVHVSTASRVVNGGAQASIRPETRERILDVARELRYRPNALARGLKLSTTGSLGMLVPTFRNPVLAAITRGAFARAWERDFVVVHAEDTSETAGQAAYERLVEEGRIDGLLVASARFGSPLLDRLVDHGVPTIFVNRRHPGSDRNVSMREEDAGRVAAEHLLELGHRRLAHVAGPADVDTAMRRREGFVEAARAGGGSVEVAHAAFDERAGFETTCELLAAPEPPTALFVSNINQAVGALAGARLSGFHVPDDLSVVSYDDDPVAEFLEPPLTVLRMPLVELGRRAVDALIDQLRGGDPQDVVVETPPELVVRASSRSVSA